MISGAELTGPVAALVAGLVTSLHCVGMCGPLACAACTDGKNGCAKQNNISAIWYHSTRLISYSLVGLLVGAFGGRISEVLIGGATRGMTWIFVLFFLAVVVGLDKKMSIPVGGAWISKIFAKTDKLGSYGKASTLGFLTPLLPCVPLYLVVAAAALSGSATNGAILMGAFGLGTVPLLFLLQNRLAWIAGRCSPQTMDYIRRGLALTSVILLLMRGTYSVATGCPMCH